MRFFCLLVLLASFNASGQLLRGVETITLLTEVPSELEMGGAPLTVKYRLQDKKGRSSKNKKISIQLIEGNSRITNISERSDQDGIVSYQFIPSSSRGITKVKVQYSSILDKVAKEADKIANDLINVDLKDAKSKIVIKKFNVSEARPSANKSNIKIVESEINQSRNSFKVEVEVRNERGTLIDDEQLPEIKIDGVELKKTKKRKVRDGVYEVSFARPKGAGAKDLQVDFLGKEIMKQIRILPEIDYRASKLDIRKAEDDVYSVTPQLYDLDGGRYSDDIQSSISLNDSRLKVSKENNSFKVIVPEGSGKTKIAYKASLSGKSGELNKIMEWKYAPYGSSNLSAKASPKKIIATGFDTSLIKLVFKDKSKTQIERIIDDANFKIVMVEGEGKIGGFSTKLGDNGLPYLEAVFTAPLSPGKSKFVIKDDETVLVEDLEVFYDVKVGLCESENIIDMDTVTSFLEDNIDLIKKISPSGETKTQGFQLSNDGPNDIVPEGWERKFDFDFPDQAKQLMKLELAHWCNKSDCKVSATNMNSSMYFFPRDELPRMEMVDDSKIKVTLPTGEDVYFDRKTKKIVGGVLEEGPLDAREDRFSRTFPDVKYKGKGYVLRVNGRGQQPESGNYNPNSISGEFGHKGGAGAMIYRYNESKGKTESCVVGKTKVFKKIYRGEPSKDNEVGAIFKFSTDKQFYDFVESNCDFK